MAAAAAGLYIHLPFCDKKCHYCDFVTFVDQSSHIEKYLDALAFELSAYKNRPIKTLFIGGGTPTVLNPLQIESLMKRVHSTVDTAPLGEATVEANPESTSAEKLKTFQSNGINRLSFGLQTTNNLVLSTLGRLHDAERFFEMYGLARDLQFENINVDLMFGLPGQSLEDWSKTLSLVIDLQPEHVSTYALKVEPGTEFYRQGVHPDGDQQADMYLLASEKLTKAGFDHYEISNFCRPGKESVHNSLYWQNADTIGIGVSSTSYLEKRRIKNSGSLPSYLENCLQGREPIRTEQKLDTDEQHRENLMLELRLKGGVDAVALQNLRIPAVENFLKHGLAIINNGRYALTPQGWLLSNQLFQHLVS